MSKVPSNKMPLWQKLSLPTALVLGYLTSQNADKIQEFIGVGNDANARRGLMTKLAEVSPKCEGPLGSCKDEYVLANGDNILTKVKKEYSSSQRASIDGNNQLNGKPINGNERLAITLEAMKQKTNGNLQDHASIDEAKKLDTQFRRQVLEIAVDEQSKQDPIPSLTSRAHNFGYVDSNGELQDFDAQKQIITTVYPKGNDVEDGKMYVQVCNSDIGDAAPRSANFTDCTNIGTVVELTESEKFSELGVLGEQGQIPTIRKYNALNEQN